MAKTILFTFDDESLRDQFLATVRQSDEPVVESALSSVRFDPPIRLDSERFAALYVAGSKLTEGKLPDIEKLFAAEITAHRANCEIKEQVNGEWITIRRRAHA